MLNLLSRYLSRRQAKLLMGPSEMTPITYLADQLARVQADALEVEVVLLERRDVVQRLARRLRVGRVVHLKDALIVERKVERVPPWHVPRTLVQLILRVDDALGHGLGRRR